MLSLTLTSITYLLEDPLYFVFCQQIKLAGIIDVLQHAGEIKVWIILNQRVASLGSKSTQHIILQT